MPNMNAKDVERMLHVFNYVCVCILCNYVLNLVFCNIHTDSHVVITPLKGIE